MTNKEFWQFVAGKLTDNFRVVLVTIVEAFGETPGRQGFKMAVSDSGRSYGTIGGGTIESLGIELAQSIIKSSDLRPKIKAYSLDSIFNAESDDMICGGKLTLSFFSMTKEQLPALQGVISALSSNHPGSLFISSDSSIGFSEAMTSAKYFRRITSDDWIYEEPLNTNPQVHVIGGGHVALALSQILSMLDYGIYIYDSRPGVETLLRNTYCENKIITPFDSVSHYIPEGANTYVVIMTPQHRADASVLKQVITMNVKYIGLMASPKKFQEIRDYLIQEGIDPELFKKVHSPIGLSIHSETPAEIAVSIAAEIIKLHKSKNLAEII